MKPNTPQLPPGSMLACRLAVVIVVVVSTATSLHATMVQPLGLTRVTQEAATIVEGTVTEVRSGRDEAGLPATWVTVAVSRTLKGPAGSHLTFKQYGVMTPLPDGTITRAVGVPRYDVGEDVVLFLRGTSPRGFTSPVGLAEGVYRIGRVGGLRRARNDLRGNAETHDLEAFLAEVTRLATPVR